MKLKEHFNDVKNKLEHLGFQKAVKSLNQKITFIYHTLPVFLFGHGKVTKSFSKGRDKYFSA